MTHVIHTALDQKTEFAVVCQTEAGVIEEEKRFETFKDSDGYFVEKSAEYHFVTMSIKNQHEYTRIKEKIGKEVINRIH